MLLKTNTPLPLTITSAVANGTDIGPRWRILKTVANGSTFNGNWNDLSVGVNSISITGTTTFNRQVGIAIEGAVQLSAFSRDYGSGTDTLSLSAVPEPSTYALINGFAAFLFVAIKRHK